MFEKIKEKIQALLKWIKADKATWKKRIIATGLVGLALASGSKIFQTTIVQVGLAYNTNPIVQQSWTLGSNQLIAKSNTYGLEVGKAGETYFLPEVKFTRKGSYFSILPKDIGNIENANFSISPTGTIKYEDDDNGIDYLYYFNNFESCPTQTGAISPLCETNFKWEVILPSYTTSTFRFNATSTFSQFTEENGEILFKNINPEGITSTAMSIRQVEFVDANGNRQNATQTIEFDLGDITFYYKIEVDDTWLQNATFPVRIDPTYNINLYGNDTNYLWNNSIVVDKNGTFWTAYGDYSDYITVASSTDYGATWQAKIVDATYTGMRPRIMVDRYNNLHLVWSGYTASQASNQQIKYVKITNGVVGTIQNITNEAYDQWYADIAEDKNGEIHIAWSGNHSGSASYKKIRHAYYATSSWSTVENLTTGSYNDFKPTITANDNYVYIFYGGGGSTPQVKLQRFSPSTSAWTDVSLTTGGYDKYSVRSAADSNGDMHVVWLAYTNGAYTNTKIAYCKVSGAGTCTDDQDISADDTYEKENPDVSVSKDGTIHVIYEAKHAGSTSYQQIRYRAKISGAWNTLADLTNSSDYDNQDNLSYSLGLPDFAVQRRGHYLTYAKYWSLYFYISDDFLNNYKLIKQYDYNSSATGTYYRAWSGIVMPSTTPAFDINVSTTWVIATPTAFTATQYNNIKADDTLAVSTTISQFGTGFGATTSAFFFYRPSQKYQFCIEDNPKQFRSFTWEARSFINVWATSSVSTTASQNIRLYIYNPSTGNYFLAQKKTPAECNNRGCVLSYTSSTPAISGLFFASSSRWCTDYVVNYGYAQSDCLSSVIGTITCSKYFYGTLDGESVPYGCAPQTDSEDLNNQCPPPIPNNVALGCKTGFCGGFAQTFGNAPYACGWYYDNAQHDCPQCFGCPSSFNPTQTICEAKTTSPNANPDYGCGGECQYCGAGNCLTVPDYQQGGCTVGNECCNGACITDNPCNAICNNCGTNSCRTSGQEMQCLIDGGTPDGNGLGCMPTNFCCCGA